MSPRLDDARRRGRVEFVPMRYFDLVSQFAAGGAWAPDCVLVHCAPPDARGYLSLGVSVSVALPAARRAPLVIAQVNPAMPRTLGNAFLHRSQIDCWVEAGESLTPYPPPPIGEVERAIGRHVAALVPDGATVQVGVGAIPQAVLEALVDHRDLALHSLLVDASVTLVERGAVTNALKRVHRGRMDIGEAMGTRRLFDFLHENSLVNMEPSGFVHDPEIVARNDRFVANNSALGVDRLEDLLVRRESVCRLVGVDDIIVDRYLEDPAVAFLEDCRDFVFVLDGGLQTGGLRKVVSLPAISDLDVHPRLLPEKVPFILI